MAKNVIMSMHTMQVDIVETPTGLIFFKECNKTYVTDINQVRYSGLLVTNNTLMLKLLFKKEWIHLEYGL